ncbi:hypothetical protein C2G38_2188192 [Gigaspora rosea]|uniref:Protein kinase domain-containing protein n=1 Tax=Gigaspora rosea TaxID=44941 RepID=A0A397V517_9GLOM|nr:hypothetical protein C2G38_2188192 [Gigaspora rosea]
MSTGQRPFDGHQFNIELALSICNGLRPECAPGTPKCYIKLVEMCMDPDPQKRPSADRVFNELHLWNESMERLNDDEIKKQFLDVDQIIKTLPTILPIHPDNMYTSEIINTQRIVGRLKSYGKCECCNQYNTSEAWCQTYDPHREIQGWSSGDKDIDKCIKEFQLNALAYTKAIEWIPFDRLDNLRFIAKGEFGTLYFANWVDGNVLYIFGPEVERVDTDSKIT